MVGGSTEPQFGHFGPSWPLSICRPPMEPSVAPGPTQTTLKSPVEGHSTCKVDDDITVDQLVDRGFRDVMRHERAYHRRVRNLRPTLGKKKVSKVKRVEIDVLMSAKLDSSLSVSTVIVIPSFQSVGVAPHRAGWWTRHCRVQPVSLVDRFPSDGPYAAPRNGAQ
jgi:hypothetical protein